MNFKNLLTTILFFVASLIFLTPTTTFGQTQTTFTGPDNNGSTATLKITSETTGGSAHSLLLDGNEIDAVDRALYLNHNSQQNVYMGTRGGNVGIGTTSPVYKLQVQGDVYANGGWVRISGNRGLHFESYKGGFRMTDNTWIRTFGNKSFYHNTGIMRTDGIFQVGSNGNRFLVDANGGVRIGDVSMPAGYKLYVEDGILTERVKVALKDGTDWADYVFEEDYERNSIEEVEKFVKENKHLPNVPSAKEVVDNGIDVAEMNATLLRQVEELWLHVIDMKKENEDLKKTLNSLKTEQE